jgi:hypothetical protein
MALADVAPVLAKDFDFLMLDTDRMDTANDVMKRYGGKGGGIPWFAFVDGDGTCIANTEHPTEGNIGFPGEEPGATHFKQMLQKAAKRITPDEIDRLVTSVIAFRDAKLADK